MICENETKKSKIPMPWPLENLAAAGLHRHKSPLPESMGKREVDLKKIADNFWNKVIPGSINECWIWNGSFYPNGYGQFSLRHKKKTYTAHRFLKMIQLGKELRTEEYACHKCDNKKCVNPYHIFIGSVLDNSRDMVNKGRSAKGEAHGSSKLKDAQVIEIKKLILQGMSSRAIGRKFNVHGRTIVRIKYGKIWTHL